MNCRNCSIAIQDGVNFCPMCGWPAREGLKNDRALRVDETQRSLLRQFWEIAFDVCDNCRGVHVEDPTFYILGYRDPRTRQFVKLMTALSAGSNGAEAFHDNKWEDVTIRVENAKVLEGALRLAAEYTRRTGFKAAIVKAF